MTDKYPPIEIEVVELPTIIESPPTPSMETTTVKPDKGVTIVSITHVANVCLLITISIS